MTTDLAVEADEFGLVTVGTWGRLSHSCRKTVTFSAPTVGRVAWHKASHRCGPAGSAWDSDTLVRVSDSDSRAGLTSALCGALRELEGLPVDVLDGSPLRAIAEPLLELLSEGLGTVAAAPSTDMSADADEVVNTASSVPTPGGADDEAHDEVNTAGLAMLVAAAEESR